MKKIYWVLSMVLLTLPTSWMLAQCTIDMDIQVNQIPSACSTGIVTITATLTINTNYSFPSGVTSVIIANGGSIVFGPSKDLTLPPGATLVIEGTGIIVEDGANTITIGTATATPLGTGATYSFTDIIADGGFSAAGLPVTLTHFTGRSLGTAAELEWGTSWEQNNQGFEVQRSRDGQTWDVAAFIPAKGKSGANQIYQYTDQPGTGRWYYRLKQIDYDGRFEIFQVISLEITGTAELYPNPVSDQLWVTTTADNTTLRIQDLTGRILQQTKVGAGVQNVSVQQLTQGVYLLEIDSAAGERRVLRFVKE